MWNQNIVIKLSLTLYICGVAIKRKVMKGCERLYNWDGVYSIKTF